MQPGQGLLLRAAAAASSAAGLGPRGPTPPPHAGLPTRTACMPGAHLLSSPPCSAALLVTPAATSTTACRAAGRRPRPRTSLPRAAAACWAAAAAATPCELPGGGAGRRVAAGRVGECQCRRPTELFPAFPAFPAAAKVCGACPQGGLRGAGTLSVPAGCAARRRRYRAGLCTVCTPAAGCVAAAGMPLLHFVICNPPQPSAAGRDAWGADLQSSPAPGRRRAAGPITPPGSQPRATHLHPSLESPSQASTPATAAHFPGAPDEPRTPPCGRPALQWPSSCCCSSPELPPRAGWAVST